LFSNKKDQTDNELKTAYGQIDNVITTAEAADDAHGSKYDKLSSALNDIRTSILSNEGKSVSSEPPLNVFY
jgi:hypothetical protein